MTVKDGNVDGLTGGVIVSNRKTAIIDFAFYRCNLVVRKSFAFGIDPVDRHTKHPLSCPIIARQAGEDNKERESMSEKEKMKSEEIAKVLAENPTAKIYLAGLAQGMKLAKSMKPEAEQPTPAGKEAANE